MEHFKCLITPYVKQKERGCRNVKKFISRPEAQKQKQKGALY